MAEFVQVPTVVVGNSIGSLAGLMVRKGLHVDKESCQRTLKLDLQLCHTSATPLGFVM